MPPRILHAESARNTQHVCVPRRRLSRRTRALTDARFPPSFDPNPKNKQAYPVAAPVVVAAGLFAWMFSRTLMSDPDSNKGHQRLAIDCPEATAKGDAWRHSIRHHFAERVKARKIGIFANDVA